MTPNDKTCCDAITMPDTQCEKGLCGTKIVQLSQSEFPLPYTDRLMTATVTPCKRTLSRDTHVREECVGC